MNNINIIKQQIKITKKYLTLLYLTGITFSIKIDENNHVKPVYEWKDIEKEKEFNEAMRHLRYLTHIKYKHEQEQNTL